MGTLTLEELPVSKIKVHPKNPRHSAKADDDLVASVKANGLVQPIVVAPTDTGYILIAGHRRLDAVKRNRLKTVPANIRTDLDTEAVQVEHMIIENTHRLDLTPIEEAEAYQQLGLFKYSQKQIAAKTGRPVKTIQTRLKLLKLGKTTQQKVHTGQLTLGDALAITEFADDPKATQKLEQAASTGNLRWTLEGLRREKKQAADLRKTITDLEARKVPRTEIPKTATYPWHAWDDLDGVTRMHDTHSMDPDDHDGCLTYGVIRNEIVYGCTHPNAHKGDMTDADRAERDAEEQERAERDLRATAVVAATTLRVKTILEAGNVPLPPALRPLVRALLPQLIANLHYEDLDTYLEAMDVAESDRWPSGARENNKKLNAHLEMLDGCSDTVVTQALLSILAARSDANFKTSYTQHKPNARRYADLLEFLGHEFCDVDDELVKRLDAQTGDEA